MVIFAVAAAAVIVVSFWGNKRPKVNFPLNQEQKAENQIAFGDILKNLSAKPKRATPTPTPTHSPLTPTPQTNKPTSTSTPQPSQTSTPAPSPTFSPTPPPSPKAAATCNSASRDKFTVKPYLVYPADKPAYPEYETAVRNYMEELQRWYCEKVGVTFYMTSLQVARSSYDYQTMRCGENPSQACLDDPKKLEGNWGMYMNKAIHGGVERWDEETAALIFSVGGGGYAGANVYSNYAGFGITGDWVLEPITGRANDWGIPCKYSDGWQCAGGVPKGSPAHELGHAFGLPHPDNYSGDSIMKWHGGYPSVGFLPHEIENLRQSPFFK